MANNQTAAPWQFSEINGEYEIIGTEYRNKPALCSAVGVAYELPDARLIAAAPELLAALEWALDQIEDDLDLDHQSAFNAARELLAKAKGE